MALASAAKVGVSSTASAPAPTLQPAAPAMPATSSAPPPRSAEATGGAAPIAVKVPSGMEGEEPLNEEDRKRAEEKAANSHYPKLLDLLQTSSSIS